MIPIRLSRDAANYIRRETEYLRLRNPSAAKAFLLAIQNAKRVLQSFPESGNHMHGLQVVGYRTLVAGDYLLDYSYDGSHIDIASVRHGRTRTKTPDAEIDDTTDEDVGDDSPDSAPKR